MQRRPDGQRQVFAAGDSDTDIEFLRDATYKLVINRNKTELMCHAYYNAQRRAGASTRCSSSRRRSRPSPYPCSTTACKNSTGAAVPCRDEAGAVIPDQQDSVY